jgi:putative transposase
VEEILMASKGTRYTEEQILRILKELESGASIAEVCRKYGVSEQTVYRWRSKYGGLETAELQRLRELELENSRLKRIVAQQALDIDGLKELLTKNGKPSRQTASSSVAGGTRAIPTASVSTGWVKSFIGKVSCPCSGRRNRDHCAHTGVCS